MNKNTYSLLLSAVLVCLAPTCVIARNAAHPLVAAQEVVVPDLGFKTLFRQLYAKRMGGGVYLDKTQDDDRLKLPYVGLRASREGAQAAFLYPLKRYQALDGSPRYLVMVEIANIEADGTLQGCHACASKVELYVFAKHGRGYRLLSSTEKRTQITGSWGATQLNLRAVKIQQVGKNSVGFFYETGYSQMGYLFADVNMVVLNEDKSIQSYDVTGKKNILSEGNEGAYDGHSQRVFSYTGRYALLADKTHTLYSLRVVYKGNKPDGRDNIRPYNVTKIFRFDAVKNQFVSN